LRAALQHAAQVSAPQASRPMIRMKARIGPVDDPLEREADRIADAVVADRPIGAIASDASNTVQRRCAECEKEEETTLQTKSVSNTARIPAEAPAIVEQVLCSPGEPLDEAARCYFEPRFKYDFSTVRVHRDAQATESARQVESLAYTAGAHIVLRSDAYAADTPAGKRLLAHELTHVVQQGTGAGPNVVRRAPKKPETPKGSDPPPVPPERVFYGETELSKEAIRERRANPDKSGHMNLVAVKYFWRNTGETSWNEATKFFWNDPKVGTHSEQAAEQFFRDMRGKGKEFSVEGIFSERQFCGPSGQNCRKVMYQSEYFKYAKKEFAYNYQQEDIPRAKGSPTERNVIAERIERFRDRKVEPGKPDVDYSTAKDPFPHEESAGGRIKSQVAPKPAQKQTGEGQATDKPSTSKSTDEPSGGRQEEAKPQTSPPKATETRTADPASSKPDPGKSEGSSKTSTQKPTTDPTTTSKPGKTSASKGSSSGSRTKTTSATPAKPPPKPASTPTTTSSAKDVPGSDLTSKSGQGSTAIPKTVAGVNRAIGTMLNDANSKLMEIAGKKGIDPDLASFLNAFATAMDVKAIITDPNARATMIGTRAIDAVIDHYWDSLRRTRQAFEDRFPDVATLLANPIGTGQSLSDYQKAYDNAVAELRRPNAQKTLLTAFVLLGITDQTPANEVERRLRAVNKALEQAPNLKASVHRYYNARDTYNFSLLVLANKLDILTDELDQLPPGLAADLEKRAHVVERVQIVVDELAEDLIPFAIFPVVDASIVYLRRAAAGCGSLSAGLMGFRNSVAYRRQYYVNEHRRLEAAQARISASAAGPFAAIHSAAPAPAEP
jgi:hypothetical protein